MELNDIVTPDLFKGLVRAFMLHVETRRKGCWLFRGVQENTYGMLHYAGKVHRSHHVAYVLFKGPIPEGLQVLHKCDNPRCVRPEHLWLGTNADNVRDRHEKRRGNARFLPGVLNSRTRLVWSDVCAIRASTETRKVLAERYGIDPRQVSKIVLWQQWREPR